MKKIILLFNILSVILFAGCFNYKDIDRVIFATAIIVDVDDNNNPVVYEEAFKASRGGQGSSEKGQRVLFKGTGKTMFEVLRDINLSSSYKINYTQIKGIIFTQKVAEKGLDKFIDIFDRGQELVIRSQIVIYNGDPSKLLNVKLKEQDYIGLFISDLIYNIRTSSRGVSITLNDFLNKNYTNDNAIAVTMIGLKKDQLEDKIEISNAAIIKNYKMVSELKRDEGEAYNFLINTIQGGSMEVSNPDHKDDFVSLEIVKNKTETQISYDGKSVKVKKIINTKTCIAEVQKSFNFNKKTLDELQKNAESNIEKQCSKLFDDYKKKGIDIFNVTEDFHRSYPREKLENIMSKTELDIEPHVIIEGSTDITSFR